MTETQYSITMTGQDELEFVRANHFVITDNGDLLFRTSGGMEPPRNVRAFAKGNWEEVMIFG